MTRPTPIAFASAPGESLVGQTQGFLTPFDLPAKATLWGFVMFRSGEAIEIVIAGRTQSKAIVGELAGRHVAEFSWRNDSAEAEQLRFRGRAVASDQELMISGIRGTGHESYVIGFGFHDTSNRPPNRRSAHEAVLAAFVVYDSPPGAGV